MAKPRPNKLNDEVIQEILRFLEAYERDHPGSRGTAYRQNSASVRIRIIDPRFEGMDRVDRDIEVRKGLDQLSDEAHFQITILLLLTEDELSGSLANMDFEDPIPSRL
jgi:stress-induced morphogen